MIRAQVAALLTALRADPALRVLDGLVPVDTPIPYVVLWTASPRMVGLGLDGEQTAARQTFQTSTVGLTPDQVRLVQEHVHAALLDLRVSVPGRHAARVKHDASQTIFRDDDLLPPVYLGADLWSLFTVTA